MNLIGIEEWYDDIRIEVPAAPNPLIQSRVRLASIEACKRSLVSHGTLDSVDIEAGEAVYKLEPPSSCFRIWRVMWVRTENMMLFPASRRVIESAGGDWTKGDSNAAHAFMSVAADTIRLYPEPKIAISEGFIPHVAFVPDPKTTKLDDRLYYYYKEAIVAGTLSKLLRMSGTAWYDPKAATVREIEFQAEISKMLANANKDEGVADLNVTMRPFA